MKNNKQINIKFTKEEFDMVQKLMNKYAINISRLVKNTLSETLKRLEKQV